MATIKKGTYRWNDELTILDSNPIESTTINIPFTCTYKNIDTTTFELFEETYLYNKLIVDLNNSVGYWYDVEYGLYPYNSNKGWSTQYLGFTREEALLVYPESLVNLASNCYGETIKYITVTEDTEVDDTFATWFEANTEPVTNKRKFTRLYLGDVAYSSGGKCFKRLSTIMKLSPPTISLNGDTLTITDTSGKATQWNVYKDGGIWMGGRAESTIDLSGRITESGTYIITVTAFADGYEESEPSNAVEYVVEESVPTNLTGYTVTIPSGWSAPAGYGRYYLEGSVDGLTLHPLSTQSFWIGYSNTATSYSAEDNISYRYTLNGNPYARAYTPTYALTLVITGGSGATKSSLIQWLVDNNATFKKTA